MDTYKRKVRLPLPPYLLVSRVTQLQAKPHEFKPAFIQTEYDIPHNAWYTADGQIPICVAIESGQCDLLLISYLGIDFQNKGEYVYRLLDCTLIFMDALPKEGQTLRYDISINSYAKTGRNLLFFFSYNCYVDDKLILKMRDGCAGFFSDEDLAKGKGVIKTDKEIKALDEAENKTFTPLLQCSKTHFSQEELVSLHQGYWDQVFGQAYNAAEHPSLRFPKRALLMLDEIIEIDRQGGPWGLGALKASKWLEPDHWYFPCHFKDDEVLAGSLVAEGCRQLLQFYCLYLGLHTQLKDARFEQIYGLSSMVRCRGQITPASTKLHYIASIKSIDLEPTPRLIADIDIIFQDKTVVHFKDMGVQLVAKKQSEKHAPFTEEHIEEFAKGRVANCFGPDFAIYDNRTPPRTPNGDLKLINRILKVDAERHHFKPQSSLVSEYDVPADPWYYRHNSYPYLPYSILMEIALQPCGFLSAYLGSTLQFPEQDLFFRNLDGHGFIHIDLDVRGKTIRNEVHLISSSTYQGTIIQKFSFCLYYKEEKFYDGEAVFGYFSKKMLKDQVGLDQGKEFLPWYREHPSGFGELIQLKKTEPFKNFYIGQADSPHMHLPVRNLDLIDEIGFSKDGGDYGKGYIFAKTKVHPDNWYFACHFYQDPVIPGSLGVESMLIAMQAFALEYNLSAPLKNPCFDLLLKHRITWKYRGQVTPEQDEAYFEVHIKEIKNQGPKTQVIADGSLWKEKIRIYEVTDLAVKIKDSFNQ